MIEIAEELERLARALDKKSRHAAELRDSAQEEIEAQHQSGRKIAYAQAAADLRARADELRAMPSAPTYAPQSKPDEVRAGQWWMFADSDAFRITDVDSLSALGISKTHVPMGGRPREMLRSALWLYLGNGSEPARM